MKAAPDVGAMWQDVDVPPAKPEYADPTSPTVLMEGPMHQNSPQYVQLRFAARERDLARMHGHDGIFALVRRVLKRH